MSSILTGLNETQAYDGAFLLTESRTYKLWESAGQKIAEAQLTADQINQIFKQVEQGATAAGGNRTMLGKGKDAASSVNKAWEELKTKVQDSGPIKGVDAMYDKAAEKLKQATGGDQGVMQYVQKYRDFAKKHPVAQSLIYATLIAAAGISGAGIGGAAALGLFKMADKLLQGEKFSSAAYQGAKTGGMAYAAGQIGQAMKGGDTATTTTSTTTSTAPGITGDMSYDQAFNTYIQKFAQDPKNPSAMIVQQAKQFAATKAKVSESIDLTESQILLVFGKIATRKVNEGIMDTLKGAAGKAADWAKTKGTNLTTKVTADKLLQAWKKAGSPTDSLDVASIIQQAGVPSASIKQVYSTMKIPFAGEKGAGADTGRKIDVDPSSVAPGAPTSAPTASAPSVTSSAPAADAQTAPAATGSLAQVQELIAKLDPKTKEKVIATLKQELSVAESHVNELSTNKLAHYKTAASADAKKADSEGDYERGNKRFSGIVRATNKQFDNDKKQVKEFAPVGGDDREPDEEEILRQLAAKWWLGTEQEMSKAQKTLAAMGWDIGQDESGDDDAGVFVIRAGDENGDSYIAFNHSDLEELNEAFNNYHANRTGFSRGQRDDERHDLDTPTQVWGLKINGKVWSKGGVDVTFTNKQAALNARNSILKNKPELEIGLVTKGGVAEDLSMKHQRDHKTQRHADTSNSLAKRSYGVAEVPNVTKSADGHPTVKYRGDGTLKAGQTRVEPTITPTTVKRKDSDRPIPDFLKKDVEEGRYDSDDYYNPRMSRDYGARNLHTDSGAYEFEKNVPAGEPGGSRGAPKSLKGISKALPADAFGRTTGKIPAGKPGKVHSMMSNPDEVDEEKQRLDPHCWDNKKIGNPKTKMKGGVRVNNCVPKESAILKGLSL